MTAAHRPGAILTPRYRGARAVANFNAADARSRATHLRAGWLPSAGVGHCNSQTGRHGPEMPARRSSARPAALFNAVSNAERPSHGCPVGYRDNTGCCASARYTVASTPFARALLPKALAGTRWSAMTAPNSDRQRPARFAAGLCRLPRPFSSLCVHGAFCAPRAFVKIRAETLLEAFRMRGGA